MTDGPAPSKEHIPCTGRVTPGTKRKRGGQIKVVIDPELVERLAMKGNTTQDMAVILGCSKDTLERRYMRHIENGRSRRRDSLRVAQYKLALQGNATMLIWLGKQDLGQRDNLGVQVSKEDAMTPERADEILRAAGLIVDVPSVPEQQLQQQASTEHADSLCNKAHEDGMCEME